MGDKPRLIVDCDPGNDDALALAVALVFGDLAGVTTVFGNGDVDVCTRNAEVACNIFGYRDRIVTGAPQPLVNRKPPASPAQPFSTLESARGHEASNRARATAGLDASDFIRAAADPATWLVVTAPLTNLALALRRDPGLAHRIQGVSMMGGSTRAGNVTPVAEFNVWSDPEAAHIVLASGAPIRMCGLNVTHQVLATKGLVERLRRIPTRSGPFMAELLDIYIDTYPDAFLGQSVAPLHDPCAVLAVTHPELFEWRPFHVAVELNGALTRGMTVVDERSVAPNQPNVSIATGCNSEAILAKIAEAAELLE